MNADSRVEEHVFVSTTPGLEPALQGELCALQLNPRSVDGGFEVTGSSGLHRTLCLWLRTASHVLLRIATCAATDERTLEQELRRVSLGGARAPPAPRLRASAKHSPLSARQIETIAQRSWGLDAKPAADGTQILLRADAAVCTVSVDCAGEFLYRRGYRQEVSMAPLRETLAAGVLLLAGYDGSEPLLDPFCGSGTLPIEAALIALKRAPGIGRSFDFERWPTFDEASWKGAVDAAKARERQSCPAPIWASDIHAGALGVARRNARRAGAFEQLKLQRVDAAVVDPPPAVEAGLVVANLPYGIRVSERADLRKLYSAFGRRLASAFGGWRAAVLIADPELEELLGIKAAHVYQLDNGGIACRLVVGTVISARD